MLNRICSSVWRLCEGLNVAVWCMEREWAASAGELLELKVKFRYIYPVKSVHIITIQISPYFLVCAHLAVYSPKCTSGGPELVNLLISFFSQPPPSSQ